MADFELTGSLNQAQAAEFELAGSLLSAMASAPLVLRVNVLEAGGRTYADMQEWYDDNEYDDEEDFLDKTGYETVEAFWFVMGCSTERGFLDSQEWPTVGEALSNCGVTFG